MAHPVIAAITTLLDEAHIIDQTITNLYNQGVDRIYANIGPCTDNTKDVVAQWPEVTTVYDDSPIHYQPDMMNMLAHQAAADGATWIVPFDADEFWHGESHPTIAASLNALPDTVGTIWVGQYHYHTREYRNPNINGLNKVAYRYHPTASLGNGNHYVTGVPGDAAYGILLIRELQYSSYDHFRKKIADRCRTIDPLMEARGDGDHHLRYRDVSEEVLVEAWAALAATATVLDPIP